MSKWRGALIRTPDGVLHLYDPQGEEENSYLFCGQLYPLQQNALRLPLTEQAEQYSLFYKTCPLCAEQIQVILSLRALTGDECP